MLPIMEAIKLKAFAIILQKVDEEKVAQYLEDYGVKTFPRGKQDFMELCYMQLLKIVSAVNRRRVKNG